MKDAAYFAVASSALAEAGIYRPALLIDLDRLNANLTRVQDKMQGGPALRIVDKSLPSLPLLALAMERLRTDRIMTFHLPVTKAVLDAFPHAHALFGKPIPAAAAAHALSAASPDRAQVLIERVTWLIDTEERLAQYMLLARSLGKPLRIAFEVNVGMQRGGFATPDGLTHALDAIAGEPLLRCDGLMGYEAHVPAIPRLFGGPDVALQSAQESLSAFVARLAPDQRAILNTGGSQTVLSHAKSLVANDVSVGSALLKPTDFDTTWLSALAPALYIATPVLKVVETRLPGPAFMTGLMQALGLFPLRGCFLYGGKFMAEPVHPPGMKRNSLWGDSSNQQLMGLPKDLTVKPDDFAFFRPTQSEAVLQQFGPLQVLEGGRVTREWAVLPTG